MIDNLTFDQLPFAVTQLSKQLDNLERFLRDKDNQKESPTSTWFNLKELCNYLPDKPANATVYGWVHSQTIPCHKGKKKLRFLKSEIDEWLLTDRKKTVTEIEALAETYLIKKGGKNE